MRKYHRMLVTGIVALSFLQGITYPSIAMGQEVSNDVPSYTSSLESQTGEQADAADTTQQDAPPATADTDFPEAREPGNGNTESDSGSAPSSNDSIPNDKLNGQESLPAQDGTTSEPDAIPNTAQPYSVPRDNSAATPKTAQGPQPPSEDYTGWVTYNGNKYWYNKGKMLTQSEVYDPATKKWHWVGKDGVMAKNVDVFVPSNGGKWVRYDANGYMMYGEDYRYGGWYYFRPNTGAMAKGITRIPTSNGGSKWVYYHLTTGKMQYGEQYINYDAEHTGWYSFARPTGAMQYEFVYQDAGKKWVYYHKHTGKMQYKEQCINKAWYYFHPTTGARAAGFTNLPSKRVYYNPSNGKMVYGGVLINNKPYFFDKVTGRQWSGNEIAQKIVSTARSFRGKHPDCPGALAANGGIICPQGPCMSFVWYVFHTAGMDVFLCNGQVKSGYPDHNYDWYAQRGRISRTPKVGDIVFWLFDRSWAHSASHAGIVVSVSGGVPMVVDAAFNNIGERNINNKGLYPATPYYATPYYS